LKLGSNHSSSIRGSNEAGAPPKVFGIRFRASLHFWGGSSDWRIKGLRSRSILRGYGSNVIALLRNWKKLVASI